MEKLRHLGFFQEAERETQTALQIHSHFSRVQLADIDMPCTNYSCRSLHSLRAKAGTVTWEAVSKLTFWVQLFPLNVTGLRCVWGKKIIESMWCSHCWCGGNSPTEQYTFSLVTASVCAACSQVQGKQGPLSPLSVEEVTLSISYSSSNLLFLWDKRDKINKWMHLFYLFSVWKESWLFWQKHNPCRKRELTFSEELHLVQAVSPNFLV